MRQPPRPRLLGEQGFLGAEIGEQEGVELLQCPMQLTGFSSHVVLPPDAPSAALGGSLRSG